MMGFFRASLWVSLFLSLTQNPVYAKPPLVRSNSSPEDVSASFSSFQRSSSQDSRNSRNSRNSNSPGSKTGMSTSGESTSLSSTGDTEYSSGSEEFCVTEEGSSPISPQFRTLTRSVSQIFPEKEVLDKSISPTSLNVQNRVWEAQNAADVSKARDLKTEQKAKLLFGKPILASQIGSTAMSPMKIVLDNGLAGVFKFAPSSKNKKGKPLDPEELLFFKRTVLGEALAFDLDEALGLNVVPMTVMRDIVIPKNALPEIKRMMYVPDILEVIPSDKTGEEMVKVRGSMQVMMQDYKDALSLKRKHGALVEELRRGVRFQKLTVLDYLIENKDRHDGNWMISPHDPKAIIAIDNGMLFSKDNNVLDPNVLLDLKRKAPEMIEKIQSIDSEKLRAQLLKTMEGDKEGVDKIMSNLSSLQKMIAQPDKSKF